MLKYFTLCIIFNSVLVGQVRFASIGDYGRDSWRLQAVSDLIDSLEVDFIITLGDNNYNYGEASTIDKNIGKYFNEYIYPYFGTYQPGGNPDGINRFFPSPGNHDHHNLFNMIYLQPYLDYFDLTPYYSSSGNERYYDFIWENVHLFSVNSIAIEPDGYMHPSVQSAWLEEQMTNCVLNHSHWRIVYFHQAPYSSDKQSQYLRWPFKEWGAYTVMAGHSHTYERLEIDGLTYFVNGLGGKSRYDFGVPVPGSKYRYQENYGAMLIEANQTEMILQFITIDGEVIDSTIITDSALPVELNSFNGKYVDNSIILNWKTETEVNNYGFELERYLGSYPWEKIAFIQGNGNSSSPIFYSHTDSDIKNSSVYHYRLKQIDTDGSFSYSREISITVDIPLYFLLSQNYPNPFNSVTKINYSIPKEGLVKIGLYDALGNDIETLVNEEKPAGTYEVVFNGTKLTSGIYFYRIQLGELIKTKTMVLMK
ncbi:MAG: metallophosphoesterase [Candidatus Kariarchaeaceae archaeon]